MARNSFYSGDVGSEVAIDTSAAEAAASATAAASSASAASTSASGASTSATNAAASYDSFDDRYLGAKSSAPTTDNDSNALIDGALYWNSTSDQMFAWDGSAWAALIPTSTNQGHINTVSGIQANVTTVAGISSNVTTVAGISSDVTAVAADASDIGAVAAKATEIGRLGTADAVADMAILGTTDVVTDMNVLATADVVSDMNTLATADIVADMNVLGTADVVADMNTLGTADVVADMNTLGTADVVADLNTLGTADVVTDMNTLGTGANVTNMATLGASGVVGNIATVAGISSDVTSVAGKATEIGRLGTADAVADMNTLGTADVVADLNTLGTADVVSDMNTLATSDNVTNMNTVADNISSVNSFAAQYRVASSAPTSSLDAGDLYFNTTDNNLYHYTGSAWAQVQSYSVGDGGLTQINFTSADNTKLDGIEASATVDQTAGEILTLLEDGIDSVHYKDGSIDNIHLAADCVTAAKIGDDQVNATHIGDDVISNAMMADDAVGVAELSATGTAGNTTFLRGDNAWIVPTDTNTTYTAGTGITLSGTEFSAASLALTTVQTAASQSAHLALTTQEGDVVVRSDENKSYVRNSGTAGTMADFTLLATPTDAVLSVDGNTGAITLNHDTLTGFVANEHLDWTADQGGTNIHAGNYTDTVYTHPTTAGYKHIPAGGSAGQILRYASAGTAAWGSDENDAVAMAIALG
jgi:hypothetical protein